MRVLFYLGDKNWSGAARAILAAARGLGARGHGVTIACCVGSRLDRLAEAQGIDRVSINTAAWAASGSLDLRKVLKDRFIEVAVVTAERDHLIVASAMRAAGRGAVLRRVASFEPLEMLRSGKLALKLAASGVIVTSAGEVDAVKGLGWSIPPAVVPLGVDAAAYDGVQPVSRHSIHVPDKGILIACSYDPTGRFRMGTVFRTLALLASRHRNVHVAAIGPGARDDDLRMHAAALGVNPVMSFLEERDDEIPVMRAANVGWVASGGDAAAFACLDFMALRIPVIAARTLVTAHYVADGSSGVLLGENDPSTIAATFATMLMDEDRRTAMGNAGRVRVQRDFTESSMIDALERAVQAAGDRTRWTKT